MNTGKITFNVQELIDKKNKLILDSKDKDIDSVIKFKSDDCNEQIKIEDKREESFNVVISEHDESIEYDDVALIQCFWGTNINRILSTTKALQVFLKQNLKVKNWIFIEAQTEKSLASFGWIKQFGAKYVFKKIEKESEGLFLKMPLWNIGASMCNCKKLLFIDSDICFEEKSWIEDSCDKLDEFDVISLAGYSKNENSVEQIESIGHKIMNSTLDDGKFTYGHAGYTLGMTRTAYDMYGKFDAVNYLDDQWFWFKLIGKQQNFDKIFLLPYKPNDEIGYYGYPVKIGSTECTCLHRDHYYNNVAEKYQKAHDFSYDHVDCPMEDIQYDKNTLDLPKWKDTSIGRILKKCFMRIEDDKNGEEIYMEEAKNEFGCIDDNNPLVIMSIYRPDFLHKDTSCVVQHKEMLEEMCRNMFTYVCISNIDVDGVDTIPYKFDPGEILDKDKIIKILTDKKIVYPKNSSVLYADIDQKFDKEFEFIKCHGTKLSNKYSNINGMIYFKK